MSAASRPVAMRNSDDPRGKQRAVNHPPLAVDEPLGHRVEVHRRKARARRRPPVARGCSGLAGTPRRRAHNRDTPPAQEVGVDRSVDRVARTRHVFEVTADPGRDPAEQVRGVGERPELPLGDRWRACRTPHICSGAGIPSTRPVGPEAGRRVRSPSHGRTTRSLPAGGSATCSREPVAPITSSTGVGDPVDRHFEGLLDGETGNLRHRHLKDQSPGVGDIHVEVSRDPAHHRSLSRHGTTVRHRGPRADPRGQKAMHITRGRRFRDPRRADRPRALTVDGSEPTPAVGQLRWWCTHTFAST